MTSKAMPVGERDEKMNVLASKAAGAFCHRYANATDDEIESSPDIYLQHSIPYLTVRTLQRQEKALNSLESDSRWIKRFAIITGVLTAVLLILTCVLCIYAWDLAHSLHEKPNKSVSQRAA